jgi:glycosyltransferase involved in cell wall biosynthesis
MRIALISEHASPVGQLGGVDGGGQNIYVGQVARHLARRGHAVEVLTRRDHSEQPEVFCWLDGVRIVHVPAGPPERVRKEELLSFMPEFTAYALARARRRRYDVVHANFFMSALVGADIKQKLGIPLVVTFHALGRVRRLYQGASDGFPEERLAWRPPQPLPLRAAIQEGHRAATALVRHHAACRTGQAAPARRRLLPGASRRARRLLGPEPALPSLQAPPRRHAGAVPGTRKNRLKGRNSLQETGERPPYYSA